VPILLMVIVDVLLMPIGDYFINGYCWLFYCWLLVIILLMVIAAYFINGYWWLFY
jgi:hypothetical protein